MATWQQAIGTVLPARIARAIEAASPEDGALAEEIRLRVDRPLFLQCAGYDVLMRDQGQKPLIVTRQEVDWTFERITRSSIYAMDSQLGDGYITLPGGHRAGLCGRMARTASGLRISECASINIRVAREVPGCARRILPYIRRGNFLGSTLIVSLPGMGKTTLLRDLLRCISGGECGVTPSCVAVVDERAELAACLHGVPQLDLGPRTDVMEGCSKAMGAALLVRSMGPRVLGMDELVDASDWRAAKDAAGAGVCVIASAHGQDFADVLGRQRFVRRYAAAFDYCVCLDRSRGVGSVRSILRLRDGAELWQKAEGRGA